MNVQKAVDQGDPAEFITSYAEQHGVDVILMPTHGYGEFRSLLLGSVAAKVLDDAKCAVWMDREEIAELQRQAGTELELCLAGGSVSTVVREAAVNHKADLVVIGRGKLKDAFGRVRTNAYAVIRDSPCPVLSI